ncbi:Sjogrens syndrome scleroderma autoantigen 1 [Methanohalobium evestigatum Z-7303]|uniref:Sjogrens syndrome scleroderma autoantigen 1 n=1 Tax=Methanohalobium evestigatum (strain ATCC BAA-1072 / DSM 3721 / NBRC 107634 / OCM 161 / Z-7303) TaxID=644295 RepID=D7EB39_METEZ|nr:Sjogren's syndrome/scleroderma autoantigen 1 family protein [Methanohalobium evestigatum]ADI74556.1 Sjogrens syndrome scleroderma autoantigen 1 [Methanohalobium evestigatum Z-7303]
MSTEDQELDKISKMLECGATMLSQHCQSCGSPLFRYQGEIICPVCQDREEPINETSQPQYPTDEGYQNSNEESEQVSVENGKPETTTISKDSDVELTRDLVLKKVNSVAQMMQEENDTRRVFEYFDIIERGMELVEKIDRNR